MIGQLQEIVVTMATLLLPLCSGPGCRAWRQEGARWSPLGILEAINGGQLGRIMGQNRVLISQAPVVCGWHAHRG